MLLLLFFFEWPLLSNYSVFGLLMTNLFRAFFFVLKIQRQHSFITLLIHLSLTSCFGILQVHGTKFPQSENNNYVYEHVYSIYFSGTDVYANSTSVVLDISTI